MVTAETAMVLPVLVLLTLVGVAAIGVAQSRIRCADAARETALEVARGGAPAEHPRLGITWSERGDLISARVVESLRPVSWLPGLTVTESAEAATEPDPASR